MNMTRDEFSKALGGLGLNIFYREDFSTFPGTLRVFCFENQRAIVKNFIWGFIPAYVGYKIITEAHNYRSYNFPRFTFRSHLKDCYGWCLSQ